MILKNSGVTPPDLFLDWDQLKFEPTRYKFPYFLPIHELLLEQIAWSVVYLRHSIIVVNFQNINILISVYNIVQIKLRIISPPKQERKYESMLCIVVLCTLEKCIPLASSISKHPREPGVWFARTRPHFDGDYLGNDEIEQILLSPSKIESHIRACVWHSYIWHYAISECQSQSQPPFKCEYFWNDDRFGNHARLLLSNT